MRGSIGVSHNLSLWSSRNLFSMTACGLNRQACLIDIDTQMSI